MKQILNRFSISAIVLVFGFGAMQACTASERTNSEKNENEQHQSAANQPLTNDKSANNTIQAKTNVDQKNINISSSNNSVADTDSEQEKLIGKYVYEAKIADDNPDNYESLFEVFIELKENNVAVFTKTKSEIKEIDKKGSWTWNKAENLLTVTFPAVKDDDGNEEYEKVSITFKLVGKDLQVVKVKPSSAGKPGDLFVRS